MKTVLAECLSNGEEFIFADDCLFNQKHLPTHAWSNKYANVQATEIVKYEPCVAVVGAISTHRGIIVHHRVPRA